MAGAGAETTGIDIRDLPRDGPEEVKLNAGCGTDYRDGWHNVDIADVPTDEDYDLSETPWPWPSNHFEVVLLDNVFEHLPPSCRTSVISELYRVTAPDGRVVMHLPVPAVGVGWDVTHHAIPSWRWPDHPRHRDDWRIVDVESTPVGPGRFVPESVARHATRLGLARLVCEVRIEVEPE